MSTAPSLRTIVWLRPDQTRLISDVALLAGLTITQAGTSEKGQSQAIADDLKTEACQDIRAAIAQADAELILLADQYDLWSEPADIATLPHAHAKGLTIATLEPIPANALDLFSNGWLRISAGKPPVDAINFIPRDRLSKVITPIFEMLESFKTIRSLSIELLGAPHQGSLAARLLNAMDLIYSIMGEPEHIDAACVSPITARGLHALPGQSLRDLHGDLTINARFSDGRAATCHLSDMAGAFSRRLTLLGDAGRLTLSDQDLLWIDPSGKTIEHQSHTPGSHTITDRAVHAIAQALSQVVSPSTSPASPLNHEALYSMCQAALLSTRTGQCESPDTIRRMAVPSSL